MAKLARPQGLSIASGFKLGLDYATKTAAILAMRRTGKTFTASVIAEEMVRVNQPFVVLDPTSAWWGLRSSADGQRAGLPVIIFGGQHGDVPLERSGGKIVAEFVLENPGFYVVDFGLFESKAAEREFATDFAERLYRLKAKHPFPLHLFVDEADVFVPQQSPSGDKRLLGAFEAIVRRGGIRGLGTTLISQRAAVVNKNVLEQIDILIALRTIGPNDRKAIDAYVKAYGDEEIRTTMMGSIASLDLGEAWIWEPGADIFSRIQIRERKTFNSSATPKVGKKQVLPAKLASVDLDAVRKRMSATIEKAKADDPAELRKEITKLKRELADINIKNKFAAEPVITEVPVIPPIVWELVEAVSNTESEVTSRMSKLLAMAMDVTTVDKQSTKVKLPSTPSARANVVRRAAPVPKRAPASQNGDGKLGKCEKALLAALDREPEGMSLRRASALAGYSPKRSTVRNAISKLRSLSYVVGKPDLLNITEMGHLVAEEFTEPLPSGQELLDHWESELGKAEWAILTVLIDRYPKPLPLVDISVYAGYELDANGKEKSTIRNAISKLRSLGLAEGGAQANVATFDFMEAIK